ncbi:hypothetical protein HDV05_004914 [Chytridiales sp. JEL 0842]|nr:hypothetical protein HDV05_004914 [Chytridiales sp. JEL 0842]
MAFRKSPAKDVKPQLPVASSEATLTKIPADSALTSSGAPSSSLPASNKTASALSPPPAQSTLKHDPADANAANSTELDSEPSNQQPDGAKPSETNVSEESAVQNSDEPIDTENGNANAKGNADDMDQDDSSFHQGGTFSEPTAGTGTQDNTTSAQQKATLLRRNMVHRQVPLHQRQFMRALVISNLTWWTTDHDLITTCQKAGAGDELITSDIMFAEHRVNGKSRGIAYLPFDTYEAACKALELFQESEFYGRTPEVSLNSIEVAHKFRSRDGQVQEPQQATAMGPSGGVGPMKMQGPVAPRPEMQQQMKMGMGMGMGGMGAMGGMGNMGMGGMGNMNAMGGMGGGMGGMNGMGMGGMNKMAGMGSGMGAGMGGAMGGGGMGGGMGPGMGPGMGMGRGGAGGMMDPMMNGPMAGNPQGYMPRGPGGWMGRGRGMAPGYGPGYGPMGDGFQQGMHPRMGPGRFPNGSGGGPGGYGPGPGYYDDFGPEGGPPRGFRPPPQGFRGRPGPGPGGYGPAGPEDYPPSGPMNAGLRDGYNHDYESDHHGRGEKRKLDDTEDEVLAKEIPLHHLPAVHRALVHQAQDPPALAAAQVPAGLGPLLEALDIRKAMQHQEILAGGETKVSDELYRV